MGRHRRKDDAKPGDAGRYGELTPEQKASSFGRMFGRSVIRAADKRLKGQMPYDQEPDQKKSKFGRRKKDR